MKPTLIFIYNTDSGLFNILTDIAHKIFSPQTYACNLCGLTYSHFGMRKKWKEFLDALDLPIEFLHCDEFQACYGMEGVSLPTIFAKRGEKMSVLIGAGAIKSCRTVENLKQLIQNELVQSK